MKFNAGIITEKLKESKSFYTSVLGFEIAFENDFYLLLQAPAGGGKIGFFLPDHPTQQPFFHKPFQGQGMYLTVEVNDVDEIYHSIVSKGIELKIDIRDEPWGERHFAIEDPNGIGIDIVKYRKPL